MIDSINTFEYISTIERGSCAPPYDHGAVSVIDGQNIKITPFRIANVPPPLALHEITVDSNIVDLALSADSSLLAVLHHQGICIFQWNPENPSSPAPRLIAEIKFHPAKATLKWIVLQQICFSGTSELVTLQKDETHSSIAFYSFNTGAGSIERLDSKPIPTSTQFTMSTFVDDGIPHAFVQLSSGDIQSLTYNDERLQTCSLPFFMPWVDVASHAAGNFAVGLSHNGHLYANSRLLVKNCTSFLVTPAHLIFTTTSHLLKFVHLTNPQGMLFYVNLIILCVSDLFQT